MAKRRTPGRGAGGRFIKARRRVSVVVAPRRRRRARRARRFVTQAARRSRYPRGGRRGARMAALARRSNKRALEKAFVWGLAGVGLGLGGGAVVLYQSGAEDYGDLARKTGAGWLAWVGAVCIGVSVAARTAPGRMFWACLGTGFMGTEVVRQVGQALSAQGAGQSDFSLRWMSADQPLPALDAGQTNRQKFDATKAAQEATRPQAALDAALADLFRNAA